MTHRSVACRALLGGVLLLAVAASANAGSFSLGAAADFALLGDDGTYMVGNNSQIYGNIGVGPGGRLKIDNPFTLSGTIYFADPVTGSNYTTTVQRPSPLPAPVQDRSRLTAALGALASLYASAKSVYAPPKSNLAPAGAVTLGPGNYSYLNVDINGDSVHFVGGADDYIVINVQKELKINNSSFSLSGGITSDHVLWNMLQAADGGDASKNLTIAGADTEFAGVFLAVDRKVSLSDNVGVGRIFGGKSAGGSDDFKFVSGATLTAPIATTSGGVATVPEPGALALLGLGVAGLAWLRGHRR